MKKKRRLKFKIRKSLTFIIAIVLFGYVSFSVINYNILKTKYEQETIELQEKLHELKDKETKLNKNISMLKDDDYIARWAREHYQVTKDGEYIIQIEEKKEEVKIKNEDGVKVPEYLYLLYGLIFLITIFTMILVVIQNKKKKSIN